jgi:hypothetical protein
MSSRMIVHPRMLEGLAAFYPSLCTIQNAVEPQDSVGQPVPTSYTDALTALPCRVSPAGGSERKLPNQTYAVGSHTINLRGHYPTITPKQRAVVEGVAYDILAVESDGNAYTTRLQVQVVT